jgi:hypothetical protein
VSNQIKVISAFAVMELCGYVEDFLRNKIAGSRRKQSWKFTLKVMLCYLMNVDKYAVSPGEDHLPAAFF